ncbi:DUF4222 domain-containing protein [Citrobacter braakii]|uniref:DUF4222 domain-containing protein n=1 Tax=Citrobacter braakii TaxID=57706 RepID=UPI00351D8188
MFSLIQRGQIYIDAEGWPVIIRHGTGNAVRFTRKDGGLRTVTIKKFNDEFERVDHSEYSKICAEIEQETNLKNLRAMRRDKIAE